MRPSLRILVVLIPALSLAWLATSLLGSGAWTAFASQSEAALALARRFETHELAHPRGPASRRRDGGNRPGFVGRHGGRRALWRR